MMVMLMNRERANTRARRRIRVVDQSVVTTTMMMMMIDLFEIVVVAKTDGISGDETSHPLWYEVVIIVVAVNAIMRTLRPATAHVTIIALIDTTGNARNTTPITGAIAETVAAVAVMMM